MEQKKTRGGKKEEPTSEELEFIYECLAKGMVNSAILNDMQDYERFPLRKIPFISRRRKEFDVAKKVLTKQQEGAYDVDIVERKRVHWQRLSYRAEEILNHLKEYYPYTSDYTLEECVVGEDLEFDSLLRDYRSGCLFKHLKNEYAQLSKLDSWDDLPVNRIQEWNLIDILGSKVDKGIFKGKCDVCKDWK
jgi:hypothetical protein